MEFTKLYDLTEAAVAQARNEGWDGAGTEEGWIGFVVIRSLGRAGYKIVAPNGYTYPEASPEDA